MTASVLPKEEDADVSAFIESSAVFMIFCLEEEEVEAEEEEEPLPEEEDSSNLPLLTLDFFDENGL